jgi:hypothetical protein
MFILLLICFSLLVPIAVKLIRPHTITWLEMAAHMLVVAVFVGIGWQVGKYAEVGDTEVWNGQLAEKVRDHDSYIRTYQCHCRTVYSGSGENRTSRQVCQTCSERRYTVTWRFDTTIGEIGVQRLDRTSRRVYQSPDPDVYASAYVGMPVSREMPYTNYILGVNRSMFGQLDSSSLDQLESVVPQYPRVYNLVDIDRVVTTPDVPGDFSELDAQLDNRLREIGPNRQANIVVVVTDRAPRFRQTLAHHWRGGKKNDVIVILSVQDTDIDWVRTITLADNYQNAGVAVEMQAALMEVGTLVDQTLVGNTIADVVDQHYQRVPMEEFEYLRDEIQPPLWAVIILTILSIIASIALVAVFDQMDISIRSIRNSLTR